MLKKLCFLLLGTLSFHFASSQCVSSFTPSAATICSGQTETFTNTSSGATGTVTYSWDFGVGAIPATSTLQNPPVVTYSTAGVKTISLTYTGTGGGGCSVVSSQNITVNQTPTSTFTSNAPQCTGANVDFTNTGTLAGVTFAWTFGAGSAPATSTVASPTGIIYSTAGGVVVSLTTTNSVTGCASTTNKAIVIDQTPTASFTSTAPQCSGANVNFTNTGTTGAGMNYSWTFGTGSTPSSSTTQNETGVTYSSGGAKTVTLTSTNITTGCIASATNVITINQTPTASFTSTAPQCTGSGVDFTNTGTTGAGETYAWNFGAGAAPATSTTQNQAGVIYSTSGSKTVTLTTTTTASSCASTATQSINIDQTPTASFTSTAPQCTGAGVNFTNTGSSGANIVYNWNFGAGASPSTSSAQNPSGIVFSTAGSLTITLTVTNSATGCSVTTTKVITISQSPTASFTSTAPQCTGTGVDFTNTGTTGAGITYSWNFGTGVPATSTTQNQAGVTYASSGSQTVSLITTITASGCASTSTQTININQTPTASFTSTAPQCTGTGVTFTNTGTVVGVTYSWSFGSASSPSTSSSQSPSGITYSSAGAKTVTLTTTDPSTGCFATASNIITINPTPASTFTSTAPQCTGAGVDFTNTGTTGAGITYSWNFGSGLPATSTTQNQSGVTYATAGTQNVSLSTTITATGCTSTTNQTININQTPLATFTSNAPQCAGNSVSFTNTGSTGSGVTYTWDFGTGASPATSTNESPAGVMYSSAGTKLITFSVNNGSCTAVDTMSIVIDSTTVASFTSNAPRCTGDSVNFTNTGSATSNITYSWNFGPNSTPLTSTLQNPTGVLFSTSGIQTITLTVTNSSTSCSSTTTQTININQTPLATFTSNAPQCAGNSVNFINAGSTGSGVTYSWDFGTGALPSTSTNESPAGVMYSSAGTKLITFSVNNGSCTAVDTMSIVIDSTTVASFTSNAPKCTGDSVNFINTGSSTSDITYSWNFGTGATPATSTLQNPSGVMYSSSGSKTVTLTVTNTTTGCSSMVTQTININLTPVAMFTSTAPQCAGKSVDFTNTGTTGTGVTFNWDFGAGASPATSSTESPTGIKYTTGGTKLITFTVNNGSCTATDTSSITINASPSASFISNAPQCMSDSVYFTNTGSSGAGFTYTWNFGPNATPLTSTLQNPTGVIFSTSGAQTITLTVTNSSTGCSSTVTQTININQTPLATFTSNAPQCAGNSVNFTNTGTSGVGVTYTWDFGTGASPASSSTESPAGVMYSSPGTKLITFSVNNGSCTAIDTMSIVIDSTTVASFTSNAPKCTGDSVNFANTGSATSNITYAWNFGPNATPLTSTLQNPTGVLFSTSGIQTITLTVTNSSTSCSSTTTQTININQTPLATFTSNAPQCAGNSVNFTNTGTTGAGVTYTWDFGIGASPASSSTESPAGVMYSSAGTKLITFSVNNGSCTAVDTMSIVIDSTTVASFTSNAPKCTGDSVNFTNTGSATSNITYAWNFGPNATPLTSTLQNPTGVLFSTAGVQTITLTVTNSSTSCSSTTTQTININQTPLATFTSNAPQCAGNSVNFTNTGTSGVGVTYTWDFGTGALPSTSTNESPAGVMYSSPGTKLITFSVNNGSCTAVDTMSIVIDSTTVASFTSNAPRCMGDSVDFTNTGSVGSDITYAWNFGPNATPLNSVAQNPTGVMFSTSGSQTITLTVANTLTGCSSTVTQTININAIPTALFTSNAPQCAGNLVNFTNTGTTGAGVTYSWDFGMGSTPNLSTGENPSGIVYAAGGMKLVTLTVNNGACSAVDTMSIAIDSLPIAEAGNDTTICANDSVQLGVASLTGYKYNWSPKASLSNDTISNPMAHPTSSVTMYIVTVTSPTGCSNTDTVTVTMLAPLIANAGASTSICRNDSVKLGASLISGQKYAWNPRMGLNDSTLSNPTASPDSTTTYTLTVTGSGCTPAIDRVTVTVNQLPTVNVGPDDTISTGASVQLNANGGLQYSWMPTTGLSNPSIVNPVANPDSTTTYTVSVTNIFGCTNSDTITIYVINTVGGVWAPTAFTPNGDGKDDIFYIHGSGISNFEMGVYNRWGEQIFYSQDINTGWDGRRQVTREDMPDGAYVYYVRGTLSSGKSINVNGMINLIR